MAFTYRLHTNFVEKRAAAAENRTIFSLSLVLFKSARARVCPWYGTKT